MKLTPKKYAQALVQALDAAPGAEQTAVFARNLLRLLRKKKQFRLLPKIMRAFEEQWNARRGIIKLEVVYPEKFADLLADLEKKLSEKLGKPLDMNVKPSKTLIGGYKVLMDDVLIDSSIESKLQALKRKLTI